MCGLLPCLFWIHLLTLFFLFVLVLDTDLLLDVRAGFLRCGDISVFVADVSSESSPPPPPANILAQNTDGFLRVVVFGAEISRIRPKSYTYIFISCDIISLCLQG